jgi:hypothetical protein
LRTICFDVETRWQGEFQYGTYLHYETAWEDVTALKPTILAATAYLAESREYRSFRPAEIVQLARLVGKADRVITFNGKCWDVPVIGLAGAPKTLVARLKRLSPAASPRHDDLWQIAHGPVLWELFVLNFGQAEAKRRSDIIYDYKFELMDRGWEEYAAFKASKARIDVGMTYALWEAWMAGRLKLAGGRPPLAVPSA